MASTALRNLAAHTTDDPAKSKVVQDNLIPLMELVGLKGTLADLRGGADEEARPCALGQAQHVHSA